MYEWQIVLAVLKPNGISYNIRDLRTMIIMLSLHVSFLFKRLLNDLKSQKEWEVNKKTKTTKQNKTKNKERNKQTKQLITLMNNYDDSDGRM